LIGHQNWLPISPEFNDLYTELIESIIDILDLPYCHLKTFDHSHKQMADQLDRWIDSDCGGIDPLPKGGSMGSLASCVSSGRFQSTQSN
jgi:hypothetical protein